MTEQDPLNQEVGQELQKIKEEQPGEYYLLKKVDEKTGAYMWNEYWNIVYFTAIDATTLTGVARYHPNGDSPKNGPKNIPVFNPLDNVEEVQIDVDHKVHQQVDVLPVPENGYEAFHKYIQQSINYPERAKKDSIQGKVYIQFMVNIDGSVEDVKPIKGIGAGCDEEAVRVIQEGPKWIPGQKDGEKVKTQMILPIVFVYK